MFSKRANADTAHNLLAELPIDLIANIIIRLPLKDILISKSVCKSWYTLISNPYFTTNYAQNSPYTTIFLTQDYYKHVDYSKSLFLLEFAANGEIIQTPIRPKIPLVVDINSDFRLTILGSCDCSVFLLHRRCDIDRVYLYNPISGLCVKVLEDVVIESNLKKLELEYRVGYIPASDECKLIRLGHESEKLKEAKILTVGSDTNWRIVDDPMRFWDPYSKQVICFNGAYHWIAMMVRPNNFIDRICTFDLSVEKSGVGIPKPRELPRLSWLTTSVMIFNNCLSVADHSKDFEMIIWTLRVYGDVDSWSRAVVLRLWIQYPLKSSILFPIGVLRNGNILFSIKYSGELYVYCLEKKTLTRVKVSDVDHPDSPSRTLYANSYAPRFYSLEGEIECGGVYNCSGTMLPSTFPNILRFTRLFTRLSRLA